MLFGGYQNKCHVGKFKYWDGTSLTILNFYFAFIFPSQVKVLLKTPRAFASCLTNLLGYID